MKSLEYILQFLEQPLKQIIQSGIAKLSIGKLVSISNIYLKTNEGLSKGRINKLNMFPFLSILHVYWYNNCLALIIKKAKQLQSYPRRKVGRIPKWLIKTACFHPLKWNSIKYFFFPSVSQNPMVPPTLTPPIYTKITTLKAFVTIGVLWGKDNEDILIRSQLLKNNYIFHG